MDTPGFKNVDKEAAVDRIISNAVDAWVAGDVLLAEVNFAMARFVYNAA